MPLKFFSCLFISMRDVWYIPAHIYIAIECEQVIKVIQYLMS